MPKLPQKKVGLIACSGEEMAEGTITRLAALKVLEELRPEDTVTLCLPLFLAGEKRERAFARFYPTIAIDGCEKRCAARATARYSAEPTESLVVSDFAKQYNLPVSSSAWKLTEADQVIIDRLAEDLVDHVDRILKKRKKPAMEATTRKPKVEATTAACACGSGIPVTTLHVNGKTIQLLALEPIFEQVYAQAGANGHDVTESLMETVKLYNPIPAGEEDTYREVILAAYDEFCRSQG